MGNKILINKREDFENQEENHLVSDKRRYFGGHGRWTFSIIQQMLFNIFLGKRKQKVCKKSIYYLTVRLLRMELQ